MDNNVLRRLALYSGVVALGSTNPDLLRFFGWENHTHPALPILVLAGLVTAWYIGWITKRVLRRDK